MPRQGRINIEGGIYHVIQRGLERREIFRDDFDREEFLRRLADALRETNHKCYGWALMPNHFHLLIRLSAGSISDLMRKLLTGYALYFNKKYRRSGYLYQNRYKSILCQEDEYLLELVRYIHLNPLRAKIVKDINELSMYRWSGHSVIVGKNKAEWQSRGEILRYFSDKEVDAVRKYVEFVADTKESRGRDELTGGGLRRSAGGWSAVLALSKTKEYRHSDERVLGDGEFVNSVLRKAEENINRKERLLKEGWNLKRLENKVCEKFKLSEKDLHKHSRLNAVSKARKVFMYLGNKELGFSGVAIGRYLGITGTAVSKGLKEGEKIVEENNLKFIVE